MRLKLEVKKLNIRDIAKVTGVSATTVSRTINNSGYVKEETRQKILKVIKENGYTPSAIARSLTRQSTSNIGVIIPDLENIFFANVIRGISEIAEQNNYNILLFDTKEDYRIEHRFLKTLKEQRLNGIIITPISEIDMLTREYLIDLNKSGVPVVLVDRDLRDTPFDGVFSDNVQGAFDGVELLIQKGHKKIAIITGPETSRPGKERFEGYKQAMEKYHIPIQKEYIKKGNFRISQAYELTQDLLRLKEPPTAIFTSNNLTTLGCLKGLSERDYRVGKDIALVGFDDIEVLSFINFKLTVIDREVADMGRKAMGILLERLKDNGQSFEKKCVIQSTELCVRGSEQITQQ